MPDYKTMYLKMFNKVTDVIEELKELQIECEDIYIGTYDEASEDEEKEE